MIDAKLVTDLKSIVGTDGVITATDETLVYECDMLVFYRGAPDVVVSGIPFSTMSPELGRQVIEAVHAALAPGGKFVAYQVRDRVHQLATPVFGPPEVSLELRNVPPMRVYCWQKAGS